MKSAGLLISALLFGKYADATSEATATFGSGTDITGSVTVKAGSLSVSIDLSNLNESSLPANCTNGGLRYHIHDKWTYNDTMDYLGAEACGSDYTGGHYDPWLACSSSTANNYCNVDSSVNSTGCVDGSTALGNGNTVYTCNTTVFGENPYACEVGDWSGKYGYLDIDSVKLTGSDEGESAWEVDGDDLDGLSVVFHCNDNTRAFCAPFVVTGSDNEDDSDRAEQTEVSDKKAVFTDLNNSTIKLKTDGDVEVDIDISGLVIPADCGDYLVYRVYTMWDTEVVVNSTSTLRRLQAPSGNGTNGTTVAPNSNITTTMSGVGNTTAVNVPTHSPTLAPTAVAVNCSAVVGSFYDPTVTCATDTQHSDYCEGPEMQYLCDNRSYSYSCNATSDKFGCAPGDLSGKYGTIDISANASNVTSISTSDELLIALELLEGRSAVLQCGATYEIVACAEWTDYSGGSSSSSNNDKGAPAWVWVIVGIGAVLLIVGAIFLCRRCRSDDAYTKIQNK